MKGMIKKENTTLLVIDLQERLMPVINKADEVFLNTNRLIKGCNTLLVPVLVTEQYPKGLGHTCKEVELPHSQLILEKVCFSCMLSESVLSNIKTTSLILCGVEAHICVLKTALDAVNRGFEVHVIADAVSSRNEYNKNIALQRMQQSGIYVTTTESILFQMLDEAGTEAFKQISKIIK